MGHLLPLFDQIQYLYYNRIGSNTTVHHTFGGNMPFLNFAAKWLYSFVGVSLILYAFHLFAYGADAVTVFHRVAYYFPELASCFVIALAYDFLKSIMDRKTDGPVSLKGLRLDFLHWLLLIPINVSIWLSGAATLWWFILQLCILAIVGGQIGVQMKREEIRYSLKERSAMLVGASFALLFGTVVGVLRMADKSSFGVGWAFDLLSALIATGLVWGFIGQHLAVIRVSHRKYPRSMFLKGVFGCNIFVLLLWVHIMSSQGAWDDWMLWAKHLGFTFNVLVGNVIYAYFWISYELHRSRQEARAAFGI